MTQPNDKVNLAVIGLGAQACEHLRTARLSNDVRIVAGVEANEKQRQSIQTEYADLQLQLFDSIAALKSAQSTLALDGLILALPHHAYEDVWQTLLDFGLPLLKEKPLGRHYEEAQRFVVQAATANCPLQTAIQRRHHPSYQFLRDYLQQQGLQIHEIHAHLHLGKGSPQSNDINNAAPSINWRHSRLKSGGGALLDAGYHLVDLIHFLIGPFEAVSATMWANDSVDDGRMNEDRSWLTGRSERCWIMLDTWVQGQLNAQKTGFIKSESVDLWTHNGIVTANREGVWHLDKQIYSEDKSWEKAMLAQLSQFAHHIHSGEWQDESIWDQLPAMRVIEEAYRLSSRY